MSFRLAAGTVGFSPVSIGETGLLLRCQGKVGIPLWSKQGIWGSSGDEVRNMGSSRVVAGNSGFLSSGDWYLGEPVSCIKGVKPPFEF